ncbi:Hydrolase tropI [Lachnellula cervina]|uniref:Hydrolase tropI n=1 Tax=Lachnellula cervina TaxID=1316786 RepID=A0A7D8ZA27_9HELO|nr:Hydrolase tropI [Lachnellula cervina]
MTSFSPETCCYKGIKHEGTAKGKLSQLSGFEVYTAFPESQSTEKGILILTDIIGHKFINTQLIADQFAENGYLVIVPDLFDGDSVPLNRPHGMDMQAWRNGVHHPQGTAHLPLNIDPIVNACLAEMRTKYGCKKIGGVGYCFGAKYVVRHLNPDVFKIDVGYIAHPSSVTMEELRGIKGPLSIAAAETDTIFPAEKRHESEGILKEISLPYQVNLYGGVAHGLVFSRFNMTSLLSF